MTLFEQAGGHLYKDFTTVIYECRLVACPVNMHAEAKTVGQITVVNYERKFLIGPASVAGSWN
jgi:hypothetical protein